jgi:hypothetical protein
MTAEIPTEQEVQSQRIEAILSGLMGPTPYHSTYGYSDHGVSFRVDDADRQILCESYRPTLAKQIAGMSDERIEARLKELFANTRRLLYGF